MFAVLTCIAVQHDLRLVVLAALICVVASSTAFAFHERALRASGAMRAAWLCLTGLVAGSGVWATHFMAMLAYQPNLWIGYELGYTVASLLVVVVGTGVGFAVATRPGRAMLLAGGAVAGFSVAAMHYTGIAALRTQAFLLWNSSYVTASLVISAIGGMGAFAARDWVKGRWSWAPPAALLVLGIVGHHFTAMTAVTLLPDSSLAAPVGMMGRVALAWTTLGLAAFILISAASLMWMERLGQRNTLASLRRALNAIPGGLAFYDSSECLRVWNEPFARLMESCGATLTAGAPRRTLIEAAARAGWFAEAGATAAQWVDDLEARKPSGASEWRVPDGRWIRHEAFRDPDGGAVTVLSDVTEHKETASAMAAARDAAEAANRAKSAFLANMSHEIRTPLNGVLGVAEVLVRTELTAEQRELVGVIQQSGGILNGLLADIIDLAKLEAGMVELSPEPVQLADLIGEVKRSFAARAEEKQLHLRAAIGPGADVEVLCDPQRLRQVLSNLVDNAVKFTDAGEVVLEATRSGDRVRFDVRDTGPGVEEASKASLFQRFLQADGSATRRHGGTGLGLALCDEYVRVMGGILACESALGEGSCFSFELDLPPLGHEGIDRELSDAALPSRTKVLVVDDNPVNRQVMEMILGSVGVAHASAQDGRQAVDAVTVGDFDAILMDIQMPVMDGLEATRRIRAWERETDRVRTPILIVSANCLKEHLEAGRAAGADAHLNKPISAAELLGALETQLALAQYASGDAAAKQGSAA